MKHFNSGSPHDGGKRQSASHTAAAITISLIAILSTFLLANSSLEFSIKISGFLGILSAFLVLRLALHLLHGDRHSSTVEFSPSPDLEIDRQLAALEDANEFFAGSLRTEDTFRLIASRVKEIVPFRNMTLHLLDESREHFCATVSEGPDSRDHIGRKAGSTDGLAGRCYLSQIVEIESRSSLRRPEAAVPLKNGTEVFGVLEIEFEMDADPNSLDTRLLDAIGTRSAPLILSSISFEKSQANALTDSTTELPNERAFHLVLENQVAESQRKGASRPLTILALDIRSFDEINNGFGHAAADRVLGFVAQVIRDNLRQMDFLARSKADEFLVILPTASKEISRDVIARIRTGFFGRQFKVTDSGSVEVELNIGWASLGHDGETPETLIRVALERKEQFKMTAPAKVLWFPAELAN